MDFAAADFSMIAHPTHGAVVIRPDSQSGCVVVDKIDIDVQRGPGVGGQEGATAIATCASSILIAVRNWPHSLAFGCRELGASGGSKRNAPAIAPRQLLPMTRLEVPVSLQACIATVTA